MIDVGYAIPIIGFLIGIGLGVILIGAWTSIYNGTRRRNEMKSTTFTPQRDDLVTRIRAWLTRRRR